MICTCCNPLDEKSKENNWDIIVTDLCTLPTIADIRNDGIYRAYGIEGGGWLEITEGYLYEYEYSNGWWAKNIIYTDSFYRSDPLIAAKCLGDGKSRLYGFCSKGIFEVEYKNDNWSSQIIYNLNNRQGGTWCLMNKGAVRNENIQSLIIFYWNTTSMGGLFELSNRGGTWTFNTIDVAPLEPSGGQGMAVGKVREGSYDCIYIIDKQSIIIEYNCVNGTRWQKSIVDTVNYPGPNSGWGTGPCIGIFPAFDAQSFFVTVDALYKYTYKNSWSKIKVTTVAPYIMEAGIGRNDGIYRLYLCGWFGEINEISKTRDSYIKSDQLKIEPGNALGGFSIGPGRGDGIHRIYVEQFGGSIYELTYKN
jgi:hypothetical protein